MDNNGISIINKQLQTERGLIYVKKEFPSEKAARDEGYSYMFTSSMLDAHIYGKSLDSNGYHHETVIIYRFSDKN